MNNNSFNKNKKIYLKKMKIFRIMLNKKLKKMVKTKKNKSKNQKLKTVKKTQSNKTKI